MAFQFCLQEPACDLSYFAVVNGEALYGAASSAADAAKQATLRQMGWHPIVLPEEWFLSGQGRDSTLKVLEVLQCTIQYQQSQLDASNTRKAKAIWLAQQFADERDDAFEELVEMRELVAGYKQRATLDPPGRGKLPLPKPGGEKLACTLCGNTYPTTNALQSHYTKRHRRTEDYAQMAAASAGVARASAVTNQNMYREANAFNPVSGSLDKPVSEEAREHLALRSELLDVRLALAQMAESHRQRDWALSAGSTAAICGSLPGVGVPPSPPSYPVLAAANGPPAGPPRAAPETAQPSQEVAALQRQLEEAKGRMATLEQLVVAQAARSATTPPTLQQQEPAALTHFVQPLAPNALAETSFLDKAVSPMTQVSPSVPHSSRKGTLTPLRSQVPAPWLAAAQVPERPVPRAVLPSQKTETEAGTSLRSQSMPTPSGPFGSLMPASVPAPALVLVAPRYSHEANSVPNTSPSSPSASLPSPTPPAAVAVDLTPVAAVAPSGATAAPAEPLPAPHASGLRKRHRSNDGVAEKGGPVSAAAAVPRDVLQSSKKKPLFGFLKRNKSKSHLSPTEGIPRDAALVPVQTTEIYERPLPGETTSANPDQAAAGAPARSIPALRLVAEVLDPEAPKTSRNMTPVVSLDTAHAGHNRPPGPVASSLGAPLPEEQDSVNLGSVIGSSPALHAGASGGGGGGDYMSQSSVAELSQEPPSGDANRTPMRTTKATPMLTAGRSPALQQSAGSSALRAVAVPSGAERDALSPHAADESPLSAGTGNGYDDSYDDNHHRRRGAGTDRSNNGDGDRVTNVTEADADNTEVRDGSGTVTQFALRTPEQRRAMPLHGGKAQAASPSTESTSLMRNAKESHAPPVQLSPAVQSQQLKVRKYQPIKRSISPPPSVERPASASEPSRETPVAPGAKVKGKDPTRSKTQSGDPGSEGSYYSYSDEYTDTSSYYYGSESAGGPSGAAAASKPAPKAAQRAVQPPMWQQAGGRAPVSAVHEGTGTFTSSDPASPHGGQKGVGNKILNLLGRGKKKSGAK